MRRPILVAALASLLVIPASAGAVATRAEYAAAADPYCAGANSDIRKFNVRAAEKARQGNFVKAGKLLKLTGFRLRFSIDQVRAIVPPPGDEQLIASWLSLIERVASNNIRLGAAVADEEFRKAAWIRRQTRAIRRQAHDLVAGFPFQYCA